jgi:hypothetical protein
MKRRVGKEPEGGSKKRKQVGNDNSLASMFAKQQAASDLNKAKEEYNAQLQTGKEIQQCQNAVWTQTSKAFDSRRCL